MEWVETTGRTVAEAKELALDQLGVDGADAEFEVVSEPKTGLLGRLKVEARVRARVRPATPRAKDTGNKRRRPPRTEGRRSDNKPSGTDGSDSESTNRPVREERSEAKPKQPRRRKPSTPADEGEGKLSDENVPLSEQGRVAEQFIDGLFAEMNAKVTIDQKLDEDEEIVKLAVHGDNLGHLIGPRGATLHSLQELTRTVVQRQTGARSGRIVLDIAGYREKRRIALEQFTRQIADQVVESQASRRLEPMNPADRKVVHDAVNNIDGVVTTSEGEEPRRCVVINPA